MSTYLFKRNQPRPDGKLDQLRSGVHVELFHDAFAMAGDSFWAEFEFPANRLIVEPFSRKFKHLTLALAQDFQANSVFASFFPSS